MSSNLCPYFHSHWYHSYHHAHGHRRAFALAVPSPCNALPPETLSPMYFSSTLLTSLKYHLIREDLPSHWRKHPTLTPRAPYLVLSFSIAFSFTWHIIYLFACWLFLSLPGSPIMAGTVWCSCCIFSAYIIRAWNEYLVKAWQMVLSPGLLVSPTAYCLSLPLSLFPLPLQSSLRSLTDNFLWSTALSLTCPRAKSFRKCPLSAKLSPKASKALGDFTSVSPSSLSSPSQCHVLVSPAPNTLQRKSHLPILKHWVQCTFSINTLGFVGHKVSVATSLLCHRSRKKPQTR